MITDPFFSCWDFINITASKNINICIPATTVFKWFFSPFLVNVFMHKYTMFFFYYKLIFIDYAFLNNCTVYFSRFRYALNVQLILFFFFTFVWLELPFAARTPELPTEGLYEMTFYFNMTVDQIFCLVKQWKVELSQNDVITVPFLQWL